MSIPNPAGPEPGAPVESSTPASTSSGEAPARRPVRVTDLVVSLILLVLVAPGVVVMGMLFVAFLAMGTTVEACRDGSCDWFGPVIALGLLVIPLVALIGAIVTVVQLVRRRLAWP